ncbi:MAG TPA: DUF3810 domain-containing protein [Salinimicrobium sp.]|nr:DUF3810 domain-containing protein [Salinimicrobium sp.]
MKKHTTLILTLLLPLQIIALKILSNHSDLVEKYYSNGIYPFFSKLIRTTLGFLPFSFGDVFYTVIGLYGIVWIVKRFKQRFRNPKKWLLSISAAVSVIYACFHLFWGLNYYREPLHKALEIENDYTTPELIALTKTLIKKSNEIHRELTGNDSIKVDFSFSKKEMFELTSLGYANLSTDFPKLKYEAQSIKPSLYSIPLTYMGFNGYLNPFTNEAQVNTILPQYKLPTTASHEVAHQLGFAAENEANFIACLATMNHSNLYFRYSGYTFALGHCLNELYKRDDSMALILSSKINYGISLNFEEMRIFWASYKNPLEPLFMATYDSYLVANNQAGGMLSYSYVVALLVNYFDEENKFL